MNYTINGYDLSNFFLANQLTDNLGIHMANVSMFLDRTQDTNMDDVVKLGNCVLINKSMEELPNFLKKGVNDDLTDLSGKLPRTWFSHELGVTDKELLKAEVVDEIEVIAGRNFYKFNEEFMKKVHKKILYTLDKEETESCYKNKEIEGYIQLSKNKFLTWY